MKSINAYFDGTAVRVLDDYTFRKNQRFSIVIQDEDEKIDEMTASFLSEIKKSQVNVKKATGTREHLLSSAGKFSIDGDFIEKAREESIV